MGIKIIIYLFKTLIISIFSSNNLPQIALILQENLKYRRYFEEKNIKLKFDPYEKLFIHFIYKNFPMARKFFQMVSPETILYKWKSTVKEYWTCKTKPESKAGRPRITKENKLQIKDMKTDNYLWGCRRIRDELKKISIDISRETIRKVIQDCRKNGVIKPNLSWTKFIKAHWLYACDFFTVDILGFRRLYVFFIIKLGSRKIVHYNITKNPTISFLRHQFSYFEEICPDSYLIHDNSGELKWFPYKEYDIKDISITPYSPNMNAYAERFIRSARQECLDWFIVFNQKQLRNILKEYIYYYNHYRPHQGLKAIPDGKPPDKYGKIKKKFVLFGLHHNYFREVV